MSQETKDWSKFWDDAQTDERKIEQDWSSLKPSIPFEKYLEQFNKIAQVIDKNGFWIDRYGKKHTDIMTVITDSQNRIWQLVEQKEKE